MTTYTIKQSAVNAKPNTTALRFVRDGAAWRVRFKLAQEHRKLKPVYAHDLTDAQSADLLNTGSFTLQFDPETDTEPVYVPNTHIKLLGLYWSGWMVWQRMREAWKAARKPIWGDIKKGDEELGYGVVFRKWWYCVYLALRQYLAWTHGNSARVIAKWETRRPSNPVLSGLERGVSLSTYYYLNGRGAVTTGSPVAGKEIAWLPEDPDNPGWTVWGELKIWVYGRTVYVDSDQLQGSVAPVQSIPLSRRPWFFGLIKPHAANGPSSPHAPCDLTFEMERV